MVTVKLLLAYRLSHAIMTVRENLQRYKTNHWTEKQ